MDEALRLLADGTLSIDGEGHIWRHRSNGRPCVPRRAENVGGKGYLRLALRGGSVMARRVVWASLHGPPPEGLQINHRDLNKQNNRPDNLELVTGAENIQHSYAHGRKRPWSDARTWRGRERLSNEVIQQIRSMRSEGALYRVVAQAFGISITHAQRLCTVDAAAGQGAGE